MSRNYEMFTEFGNDAVDAIVTSARVLKLDWPNVVQELIALAERHPKDFGEAVDTDVRRAVYDELKFNTPFYV